ncbi:YhgE/Pip domain-containing protein [Paenibacillus ginsengarvi]|uniref:YhgE/Pip domain-containing protein n=1 Tax=Paenibacillus ginsengarvi TaxID=400777 RepID=A0A3B0BNG8_9BACL|nr:YhgE/Pip domain-containing protein [Paenibacillus ginsengarvi]RKN74953.1 YhgE/Pip domain-containing protein [Paenibacillus ginsengarvi]
MFKGIRQFGKELAAIGRNHKVLIPVIAVIMVPVLYAAMFLGAFWDPYGRLDDLPVAIVNRDKGAEFSGKTLKIGSDFEQQLKENKQFDWRFVSQEEATEGLKNNTYYMAIEIPEDFSEKTTTLTTDHPAPAKLTFLPNESYNFLASQIGNTAVEKMKAMLNKEVTEAYARTVFGQMEQLADGLGKASDGAGQLADGTSKAKDGAQQIEQNLQKLASGSLSLQEGVSQLAAGGGQLNQGAAGLNAGAANLADGLAKLSAAQQELGAGASELGSGAASLGAGASSLGGGLAQLADGSDKLAVSSGQAEQAAGRIADGLGQSAAGAAKLEQGAAQLSQGLEQLAAANAQLAQDASFQKLLASSKQLAAGAAEANKAQQQLSEGAKQLHGGTAQLKDGLSTFGGKVKEAEAGAQQVAAGGQKLTAGAEQFNAGMTQFGGKLAEAKAGGAELAAGAKQLSSGAADLNQGLGKLKGSVAPFVDGTAQLEDGAKQVAAGLLQLDDGSHELSGKLSDASTKTSGLKASDSTYDMFTGPIELDVQRVNEVPNYGTGFAPYFLSLGLYVGALLLTIVYSVREPAERPTSGWSWFWSKALTLSLVGVVQALVADAVLLYGLDLEVKSVPLFVLFSVLTSVTFMMLIQFLVTVLQNPGRFIAIVVLIFQLTSSAGTFPLELIPSWLQKVTPWMPMTYSVSGFKDVISSGDFGAMWTSAGVLAVIAVLFAALTYVFFTASHRKLKLADQPNPVTAA